jgi:hypothetical protein
MLRFPEAFGTGIKMIGKVKWVSYIYPVYMSPAYEKKEGGKEKNYELWNQAPGIYIKYKGTYDRKDKKNGLISYQYWKAEKKGWHKKRERIFLLAFQEPSMKVNEEKD